MSGINPRLHSIFRAKALHFHSTIGLASITPFGAVDVSNRREHRASTWSYKKKDLFHRSNQFHRCAIPANHPDILCVLVVLF
ncbi:hypothetical protein OAT16_00030 [Prolixibacteraceae bacterium]|nr:hypothetical protein [Prolixibacteraceae bacterium]